MTFCSTTTNTILSEYKIMSLGKKFIKANIKWFEIEARDNMEYKQKN